MWDQSVLDCGTTQHRGGRSKPCVAPPVSAGVVGDEKAECQTASRPGGGCRGLQVGGAGGGSWEYGRGSQHGWFSTLGTPRPWPWHNRRCRNSRSVREKFFKRHKLNKQMRSGEHESPSNILNIFMCTRNEAQQIPAGTVRTGKASPHCGHACVSPGGSAE